MKYYYLSIVVSGDVVSFPHNAGLCKGDVVLSFCHGTARPDVQAHAPSCPLLQVRTSLAQKMGLLMLLRVLKKESISYV